jgi:phosphoglucosamine mutase
MSMMFGTDGIRGTVGSQWINEDFFQKLAWLMTRRDVLFTDQRLALLACDTRASGMDLKCALVRGLRAGGVDVIDFGVLPTPVLSYLMQIMPASLGLMVSASHNAYTDNGLKLFQSDGSKLSSQHQLLLAQDCQTYQSPLPSKLSGAYQVQDGFVSYVQHCIDCFSEPLQPLTTHFHIVVDAAHGASHQLASLLLSKLAISHTMIGASPNGININRGCGSTDLGFLRREVLARGADLGVAFDGDGDRVLMVDHCGACIDGDHLLLGLVQYAQLMGQQVPGVVGTVMSNQGLAHAMAQCGVSFKRASVGDSHVVALLRQHGWRFGAEPSGHVIDLDFASTGDGLISALQWLALMAKTGMSAEALRSKLHKYPQVLINVPMADQYDFESSQPLALLVAQYQQQLGHAGRILLRSSGTEAVMRVMVEGNDPVLIQHIADRLSALITEENESLLVV